MFNACATLSDRQLQWPVRMSFSWQAGTDHRVCSTYMLSAHGTYNGLYLTPTLYLSSLTPLIALLFPCIFLLFHSLERNAEVMLQAMVGVVMASVVLGVMKAAAVPGIVTVTFLGYSDWHTEISSSFASIKFVGKSGEEQRHCL
ncbi:hypothetical protein EDC04DRAFT_175149 [Pisolithus marmoratus]|nr:hypothetical protein EDC04DRAFT_175149 [Pisolithus marmoratus]